MIKNERQYRITKTRIGEFADALAQQSMLVDGLNSELRLLERSATESQLETMREEIVEYESLVSGDRKVIEIDSFDDLSKALISARIAARWSQKDLAEKLGIKEQQVQRYEASDYASASLSTISRVADALGVRIRKGVILSNVDLSLKSLWRRLKEAGLSRDLVVSRILPKRLSSELDDIQAGLNEENIVLRIVAAIGRIFGLAPTAFLSDRPPALVGTAGSLARFKVSASAEATKLGAYTVYAHYLALTALCGTTARATRKMPETAVEFRHAVQKAYGALTFANALHFAWDCGVVVLPLNDSGAFHGACWRVKGRHVVVIKQRNRTIARWFFDLLHELRHTLQEEKDAEFSVIEAAETSDERRESKFEKDADHFAANVLLDGRAGELAKQCEKLSGGSVERLKSIVPEVAHKAGVDVGALANYVAFLLSLYKTADWWGAATNLQQVGPNPWEIARDIFLQRTDLGRINPVDRELIMRALGCPDEVP